MKPEKNASWPNVGDLVCQKKGGRNKQKSALAVFSLITSHDK